MNIQLRLAGFFPRCAGCSTLARRELVVALRQASRTTRQTTTRGFSSALRSISPSPSPVFALSRPRCAKTKTSFARRQLASTTTFSPTSPSRPRPAGNNEESLDAAADSETKEGGSGTPPAPGKATYPARLLIYHAGTGKITFLACLKLTTLFVFGFFDMIMTPAYIAAGEPLLKTAGVAICGLVPAMYVAWSTSPFVASVHMHLPPYARWSRAMLERFARAAPPATTRLDVTTISLIGKPRVSSVALADLRPARRRLGMVNFERDTAREDAGRRWWQFRAVGQFNVQDNNEGTIKTGWVWKEVAEGIRKRAGGAGAAGAGVGAGDKVKGKQ